MESFLNWNEIQKTIDAAIQEHNEDVARGIVGGSDVLYIYNALKSKGYLKLKEEHTQS